MWYNQDSTPVSPSLNAALTEWIVHGKKSLVHHGTTYLFPARILEDPTFINEETGRETNDSYLHVAIKGTKVKYVWTHENVELSSDETDVPHLPPPINYVGFTVIESANIYSWLLGDTDCHDIRIRENLILRYNPDDPYQLMTKYISYNDDNVKVVGYPLRGTTLSDEQGAFVPWYNNAHQLQPAQKCRELEAGAKHIYDGKLRNGPFYSGAPTLPNLKDFPIGEERPRLWQWQIGKEMRGTFDIKMSKRITSWLARGKDDVVCTINISKGVEMTIVLHHVNSPDQIHTFSITGPGNENGIAFEYESAIQEVPQLVAYEPTASWIYTKTSKAFIGYKRLNEWIENGTGNIQIAKMSFQYPARIIINGQFRVMVAEIIGGGGGSMYSHASIPRLNVDPNQSDPNVNFVFQGNGEHGGTFTPQESLAIKEWKQGNKFRHQIYLERSDGEVFVISHFGDEGVHHFAGGSLIVRIEPHYTKFKRAKCLVCSSMATKMCNQCKNTYYCGNKCWVENKCKCN
jgi:hypothetical protein